MLLAGPSAHLIYFLKTQFSEPWQNKLKRIACGGVIRTFGVHIFIEFDWVDNKEHAVATSLRDTAVAAPGAQLALIASEERKWKCRCCGAGARKNDGKARVQRRSASEYPSMCMFLQRPNSTQQAVAIKLWYCCDVERSATLLTLVYLPTAPPVRKHRVRSQN